MKAPPRSSRSIRNRSGPGRLPSGRFFRNQESRHKIGPSQYASACLNATTSRSFERRSISIFGFRRLLKNRTNKNGFTVSQHFVRGLLYLSSHLYAYGADDRGVIGGLCWIQAFDVNRR